MPLYDYLCPTRGPYEARGSTRESNAPALCTSCATLAPRIMSAPRLNLMSSHNGYAEMRNEKSAHEPDVVHRMKAHGHGHGRGHTHRHPPARLHEQTPVDARPLNPKETTNPVFPFPVGG